ncbi:MAG: general secretion pathway protein GspK [Rhodospirillales bacterium]
MNGNRTSGQRGFILLVVMWLMILLSGIAIGMATTVRTDSRLARNQLEEARTRHLAQAGIYLTVMKLLGSEREDLADAWNTPAETVTVLGVPVRVRIVDECAKVDVNSSWGLLVTGLAAAAAGDDKDASAAIGPAILDWRDPDGRRRLKGAEDDAYSDAGQPFGARDGPLETIEEVQMILGVTPTIYRRLEPLITVDCLNAGVDPVIAPPSVLAAVPGIEPAALAAFLDARERKPVETVEILAQTLAGDGKYFEASRKTAFNVVAAVEPSPGVLVTWRAIVRLTGDPSRPYLFRSWKRIPSDPALAPDSPREGPGPEPVGNRRHPAG